jgi:hypothetical protein
MASISRRCAAPEWKESFNFFKSEAWPSSPAAGTNPTILDGHAPPGLAMTVRNVGHHQ